MLSQEFIEYLKENGYTISCAESLTAGHLQGQLSALSGASNYFAGGLTAYNIDQKVNLLNVDRDTAAACDCVSEDTAIEMVNSVADLFKSEFAIATTGYSEPYPQMDIETPQAYIAVKAKNVVYVLHVEFEKHFKREEIQRQCAGQAIMFINHIFEKYVVTQS